MVYVEGVGDEVTRTSEETLSFEIQSLRLRQTKTITERHRRAYFIMLLLRLGSSILISDAVAPEVAKTQN